jgi:hypothetical protein
MVALVNCVFATYIVVWLTNRFKKPGMSGGLKREIRSRYVEYVVLYAVFNWPICAITKPYYNYLPSLGTFLGGTNYIGAQTDLKSIVSVIILFSGILIALQRLRDRLVAEKLKYLLTCKFKFLTQKLEVAAKEASLNTFLATSLNTELVVTILKGITILAAGSSDNTDNMKEQEMLMVR